MDLKYLELLSDQYKNISQVTTEIINLKAILNLPKGTEHFLSDIHGEYDSFYHVLKNASGVIRMYIEEVFGANLRECDKKNLATLIYYPEEKLQMIRSTEIDLDDWYKITLFRLVKVCKRASSKYTRSKVRKALPSNFSYILEELIHEDNEKFNKQEYYNEILSSIISLNRAQPFIIAIAGVIQRLAIDHLHVIGDIYDRGKSAEKVMDLLCSYHSVDVQWGNHDILWIGASSGSLPCICNAIRFTAKYNNLHTLEEGYGINLVPLVTFAMENYANDDCILFAPNKKDLNGLSQKEADILAKVHKAITIIQFKIEGQVIKNHPEYNLSHRLLLDKIDLKNKTINVDGNSYPLLDLSFPTIDFSDPYKLSEEEETLIHKLKYSFINCDKLKKHIRFLMTKGSMYKVYNNNLLFHGCIPMDQDGNFIISNVTGQPLSGKKLFDKMEIIVRQGYFEIIENKAKNDGTDFMWYLWCGSDSPLFGKSKMATFERYFIKDKETHKEHGNHYFNFRNDVDSCVKILNEFGLNLNSSKIINGHVPVEVKKGESPVKASGKLLVIDGGLAKPYQPITGIAGYTLIYNSHGLVLAAHEPFTSLEDAILNEKDIISKNTPLEYSEVRQKVGNTDNGKIILEKIQILTKLVDAYRNGIIKQKE